MNSSQLRLIALATTLLLLSACGAPAASEEPAAPPEAPEATHTHAAPAEEEPQEPAAPPAGNAVSISSMSFAPRTLTVSVGTTVIWTNSGGLPHTVTADDGTFASPALQNGDEFGFTFTEPGTYDYYCEFHGAQGLNGMSGTIIVEE